MVSEAAYVDVIGLHGGEMWRDGIGSLLPDAAMRSVRYDQQLEQKSEAEEIMPHPEGGHGNHFEPVHTFEQAYALVGKGRFMFSSTTGEEIVARRGRAGYGMTRTIVFHGERSRHGNVCPARWGYRANCSRTRIGQCTEALDKHMP